MTEPQTKTPLTVIFEQREGVGLISFNRPPANAYDLAFHRQFNDAIAAADADPATRAVVIHSRVEKFFCAGADIKTFAANTIAANQEMVAAARSALARIEASGKPFIACLAGHTLGGGLEIALACDLRFAALGSYKLGLPEVRLGLIPGNGGTQRLSRLIGPARAFALLAKGDSIDPEEAHRIGLVNTLFEPAQLLDETLRYAGDLARGAPLAIAAIKQAVRDGLTLPLAEALQLEARLVDQLYATNDAKIGLKAFLEKRYIAYNGT
ncbi:MAG: enoyl-CoA hydratase/isomerase family protein [Lacunisphaera sp.]|nr:enoyl-CoA hydratase/isomerase family protein [Lacunisphaera sp.]